MTGGSAVGDGAESVTAPDARVVAPDARVVATSAWADDPARLRSARRLRYASHDHPALNRLSALASQVLRAPHAQVSLLTEVQTVAAATGLPPGYAGSQGPLGDSLCTVTAASGGPLVLGDATADARVADLPPVRSGAVVAYLGVPLVTRGTVVGALCVFDTRPRAWGEEDVLLLEQLAASVVTELELHALDAEVENDRLLWELAIDAGGVGTFDWDLRSGALTWDDRLLSLFGYTREEFDDTIDAFDARVHPQDLPGVQQALSEAIASAGVYEAEYRVVLPDGTLRWVGARGRALPDEDGTSVRVVGAAFDTSVRREAEARVARVMESMSAAFYSLDQEWRFTYVNAEAERLLGRSRGELLGGVLWELFPATVGSVFETGYTQVLESGEPATFDAYYPPPLDGWYELRVWPSEDGLSVYFLEVTDRRAAQRQQQAAAAQAALLAEVTSQLTETLDPEVQAVRLARMVVPTLASWAVVTLLDDDPRSRERDGVRTVAAWPADPGALPGADDDSAPAGAGDPDGETFELQARGRTLGRLVLGPDGEETAAERRRRAEEVAERAALALDNARLHRQRRRLVEELQRSMLTEPPQPDHVEIAVRYQPAAEDVQVGGDWYDAFLQPDGATVLVIGDVVGHDSAAAAAMGQVRTLLRAVAADRGEAPARVLGRVDRVMATLQVASTATVVVARFEQTDEERREGVTRLRWSNAGHPPPVLLAPDGTSVVLEAPQADLLLGIDPDTERVDTEVVVERGSTLLLYTDGLLERRGQSLDEGIEVLRALLEELDGLPLQELCDELLARLVPQRADDDVALVAVRAHRQDRPRPPEAGPEDVPPGVPADSGPAPTVPQGGSDRGRSALAQVELEPDVLAVRGARVRAPAGGEGVDEAQAAPALGRVVLVGAERRERRVVVVDLDADRGRVGADPQPDQAAAVAHRVGDQLRGEQRGQVDHRGGDVVAPQGVAEELPRGPRGRRRRGQREVAAGVVGGASPRCGHGRGLPNAGEVHAFPQKSDRFARSPPAPRPSRSTPRRRSSGTRSSSIRCTVTGCRSPESRKPSLSASSPISSTKPASSWAVPTSPDRSASRPLRALRASSTRSGSTPSCPSLPSRPRTVPRETWSPKVCSVSGASSGSRVRSVSRSLDQAAATASRASSSGSSEAATTRRASSGLATTSGLSTKRTLMSCGRRPAATVASCTFAR